MLGKALQAHQSRRQVAVPGWGRVWRATLLLLALLEGIGFPLAVRPLSSLDLSASVSQLTIQTGTSPPLVASVRFPPPLTP